MQYSGMTGVFDLDDTLASLRDPLNSHLNKLTGSSLTWADWYELKVEDLYNITFESFIDLMLAEKILEEMKPHDESVSFLTEFRNGGGKIVILTARGWHPESRTVTEKWLNDNGLPFDELMVSSIEDHKEEYIKDIKPTFTVDDSVRHCLGYASCGLVDNVFAYSMPWNESVKPQLEEQGVKVIHNLYEITTNL